MAPTADQLKQYLDGMVDGILNGTDIDAAQLPVANGVALKQLADELNANPSDEIVGRLRAALLILAGADPLDAMRELLDVAQNASPPKAAAPGDLTGFLNGLGTPNLGGVTPAPAPASTPDPAPAADPATTTPRSRRRGQR
jgi:hypothetical protein